MILKGATWAVVVKQYQGNARYYVQAQYQGRKVVAAVYSNKAAADEHVSRLVEAQWEANEAAAWDSAMGEGQ